MIEAAFELTAGRFSTQDIQALLNYLKEMLSARTELLDGAREVLEDLSADYPLALITKGDLRHQQAKIDDFWVGAILPLYRDCER